MASKEQPKKFIPNPQHQGKSGTPIYKPVTPNSAPTSATTKKLSPFSPSKPPLTPTRASPAPVIKPNSPAPIKFQIQSIEEHPQYQPAYIAEEKEVVDISSAMELHEIYHPEDRYIHNFRLNHKCCSHDPRDYIHEPTEEHLAKASYVPYFSLSSKVQTILNQGDIGSCVANATKQYILICTNQHFDLSRLFHYYFGRLLGGESNIEDSGLDIRAACQIISKQAGVGAVPESLWAYDTSKFATMPPIDVIRSAKFFRLYTYTFIQGDLSHLKSYLLNFQRPIMFGMEIYSSFVTNTVASTGIVPVPNTETETKEGGHCTLIVGYDDNKQLFECVNSWGVEWGAKGFFYLPYEVVGNPQLCYDFVGMNFVY
jgi:C1A family cysteine protease